MKNKIIIGLFYLVGLLLLSFGICMLIFADLGAGPWDAMYVGLSQKMGLTVGTWVFIVGFLLILLNALLLKKKPDFFAVITIFLIGSFIDFWLIMVFSELVVTSMAIRVSMLVSGIFIMAIGISFYLQSNFARNPIDNLMLAVQYRTGKSLSFSKTIMEVTVLVIALIIGGPIGIGTVLVAFGIGPLIQLFYKWVTKFKSGIIHETLPLEN
ncbi:YczE/YyaS/YitT family protein [Jeotgalibacillus soli]|uniref:Permease n=1 Tax=Jeotgalibacillus soli TaxID=889306 RepID=A0A0C2W710_9BACL|nr:hypothetical protein [Jeotgalibacillus soli]KIL51818.1 hypothetical protein KP78_01880 [Jeotgalibacillus soli]